MVIDHLRIILLGKYDKGDKEDDDDEEEAWYSLNFWKRIPFLCSSGVRYAF